ncbi:MAG: hypothetical protein KAG64_00490 [Bacteroidales bacterium]|nr:hypothetical protein [Bacteroidales bacterium]
MSLITKVRLFFLNRALKKEERKLVRQIQIFNLDQANSIAVVYDGSSENDYNRAAGLIRHLNAQGKMVKSIGLALHKEKPHYMPLKLNYDIITLKELNWYKKPQGPFVDEFIAYPFDILINLDLSLNDSLRYLITLSHAKFKIGLYNEDNKGIYDFMLEGIEKNKVSLFIKELLHYLEIFNKK